MNDCTLLHRVIKPWWLVQNGVVSSQAFRPEPKYEKQMSVYDGDQITAEASWHHYTRSPDKSQPSGVLSVTVSEFSAEELSACPDPCTFAEHVLIDFREFGTKQIKRKSANIRDLAVDRGWQYRPPSKN